jgi:hypothetical protein
MGGVLLEDDFAAGDGGIHDYILLGACYPVRQKKTGEAQHQDDAA